MRRIVTIFVIFLLIICLGCKKHSITKRDIVLEVAASHKNMFDTPMTRAEELYNRYCSVCHGATGLGDGFNAYNLTPKPRNFTDSLFVARMDTALIRETISGGGKAVGLSALMPKWGKTLTKSDIKEITDYIFYLSRQESQ